MAEWSKCPEKSRRHLEKDVDFIREIDSDQQRGHTGAAYEEREFQTSGVHFISQETF